MTIHPLRSLYYYLSKVTDLNRYYLQPTVNGVAVLPKYEKNITLRENDLYLITSITDTVNVNIYQFGYLQGCLRITSL